MASITVYIIFPALNIASQEDGEGTDLAEPSPKRGHADQAGQKPWSPCPQVFSSFDTPLCPNVQRNTTLQDTPQDFPTSDFTFNLRRWCHYALNTVIKDN